MFPYVWIFITAIIASVSCNDLLSAVRNKNTWEVMRILEDPATDIEASDHPDTSPLFVAIMRKRVRVAKVLIQKGADVNVRYWNSNSIVTPLHLAVKHRMKSIVTLLINSGANPNARTDGGHTPLHFAAGNVRKEIVDILLANGAYVDAEGVSNERPLHKAAESGTPSIVERLLEAGANIEAEDNNGNTPLHLAADVAVVETFVRNGAPLNKRNRVGKTPFHHAIYPWSPRTNAALSLLKAGADLSIRDDEMNTVLHTACKYMTPCDRIVFKALLRRIGYEVNSRNSLGHTPLQLAVDKLMPFENHDVSNFGASNISAILLIEAGADVNDLTSRQLNNILVKFWPQTFKLISTLKFDSMDFDNYILLMTNINVPGIHEYFRDVPSLMREYVKIYVYPLYRILARLYERVNSNTRKFSRIEELKLVVFDELACELTRRTYMEKIPLEIFSDILDYHTYYVVRLEATAWNLALASYTLNMPRVYNHNFFFMHPWDT